MDPISPPPDISPAVQDAIDIINEEKAQAREMNERAPPISGPSLPPTPYSSPEPMESTVSDQISETVVNGINAVIDKVDAAVDQVREWF